MRQMAENVDEQEYVERPTTGRALAHNDGGVLASTRICIRIRAAAVPSRARSLTSYCLDAALGSSQRDEPQHMCTHWRVCAALMTRW